ncbi:DMT family transporter [Arenimonas sp.]|uniref:DMT family transporter n=1 Tax=Arenimonas sp. TaxID=1872635 RepID=UPI0039E440A0
MQPQARAYAQIHLCVLLWGFTAILGKLISLPALALVCWRMLLVCATLCLLPRVWRGLRALPSRLLAVYAGIGVVVALHWLTFYGAIKLSNASVAASCLALGSVFAAVLEPWIAGRRFDPRELLLGAIAIPGIALLFGGVPAGMHAGIAIGVLSAFLTALFSALNKRYVEQAEPLTVTGVELGAGLLFLVLASPLLPGGDAPLFPMPDLRDAALLLTLAWFCTLLPFSLSLVALRHVSAFSVQLALNLEPVYAIAIAIALLREQHELSPPFYAGVALILLAVFAHAWLARRSQQRAQSIPIES